LVVVTHSPALAERFNRRYEMVDRRLVDLAGASENPS
jgi:ABC-type lipoprotein export system ATPase subunit